MSAARRGLPQDVSWVLEPLMVLSGVRHALVLTGDGMVTGKSADLGREAAEGAAAMMSALQGAARTLAQELSGEPGTEVEQVVIATNSGFAFAVPAAENSVLAVYADASTDMEILSHHVQIQVSTLGAKTMNARPRQSGTDGS